jgi:hypothetical protein
MPMDELHLTEDQKKAFRKFLEKNPNRLEEDEVKELLRRHLESNGWQADVKRGKTRGIDIEATKGTARWIIEAKGWANGSEQQQGEYFKDVLGELLQRMRVDDAKYSVAFPDLPRYRRLWEQFPDLAKRRTGISCLFVDEQGGVVESSATQN